MKSPFRSLKAMFSNALVARTRMLPFSFALRLSIMVLAVGALAVDVATAANWAWSTSPARGYFTGPTNWASGSTAGLGTGTPSSGKSLYFGTSNQTLVTNDNSGFACGGITYNSGYSGFTISGNAFALTGGITNNCAIGLPGNVTIPNAGDVALGGVISGTSYMARHHKPINP